MCLACINCRVSVQARCSVAAVHWTWSSGPATVLSPEPHSKQAQDCGPLIHRGIGHWVFEMLVTRVLGHQDCNSAHMHSSPSLGPQSLPNTCKHSGLNRRVPGVGYRQCCARSRGQPCPFRRQRRAVPCLLPQVLRTFGHNDGYGTTMPVQIPIQPTPGVFDEAALQRYDFVMDALAKVRPRITCAAWQHPWLRLQDTLSPGSSAAQCFAN